MKKKDDILMEEELEEEEESQVAASTDEEDKDSEPEKPRKPKTILVPKVQNMDDYLIIKLYQRRSFHIGIYLNQFICWVACHIIPIVNLLVFKTLQLIFLRGGYTAVNVQSGFSLFSFRAIGKFRAGWDDLNFSCHRYSPFMASYSSFG